MQRNAIRTIVAFVVIFLVFLNTAEIALAENVMPFPDIGGNEFFSGAAERLHHAGVFIGDAEGKLNADEPFTRAQMAVVLGRITGQEGVASTLRSETTSWVDDAEIPDWAQGAFVLSEMREWFVGRDDGTVGPNEYLSWAEISILLARITDNGHLARGDWPTSALSAGRAMQLYDGIPHTPQANLPILRGQMTVAVWNAMITPSALGTDEQGADLLKLHHSATAQEYLPSDPNADSSGVVLVQVHLADSHNNLPVQLQLGETTQTLTANIEGRVEYRFTDLAFREYDVVATANGYEEARSSIVVSETNPSANITLSLAKSVVDEKDADLTTQEIAAAAIPATVTVLGNAGSGSGFHIGQGMIITNHHVVDGNASLDIITHDDRNYRVAGVYAFDIAFDIAILSVPNLDIPTLSFSAEEVQVGEDVVAVGSPLGILGSTVTSGIISARRDAPDLFSSPLLQTTASLNPGSSGGPLLNSKGLVIGVNTFKADGEGLNFAVPAGVIEPVVSEARHQSHAYPIADAFDASLSIAELNTWLQEAILDSVFWGSEVWIADQGDTVLFTMITDSNGCGAILDMAQDPEQKSNLEHLVYLIANHIHANTDMVVYGGISCLESWRYFPDYLYEGGWEVWESDGRWFSRLVILNIYFRDMHNYEYSWLPN